MWRETLLQGSIFSTCSLVEDEDAGRRSLVCVSKACISLCVDVLPISCNGTLQTSETPESWPQGLSPLDMNGSDEFGNASDRLTVWPTRNNQKRLASILGCTVLPIKLDTCSQCRSAMPWFLSRKKFNLRHFFGTRAPPNGQWSQHFWRLNKHLAWTIYDHLQ